MKKAAVTPINATLSPLSSKPNTQDTSENAELIRRACGCVRTSDKLKNILELFPQPPPPTPNYQDLVQVNEGRGLVSSGVAPDWRFNTQCLCTNVPPVIIRDYSRVQKSDFDSESEVTEVEEKILNKPWMVITELVSLVQLSVTATALILYYLIYCYMQLIYYTLRSAMYFHHADTPMKITISLVTVTGLIIGVNMISRMEQVIGFHMWPNWTKGT